MLINELRVGRRIHGIYIGSKFIQTIHCTLVSHPEIGNALK